MIMQYRFLTVSSSFYEKSSCTLHKHHTRSMHHLILMVGLSSDASWPRDRYELVTAGRQEKFSGANIGSSGEICRIACQEVSYIHQSTVNWLVGKAPENCQLEERIGEMDWGVKWFFRGSVGESIG